jgi:glycosyltransferase involved in cell wall biosynthesis
MMTYLHIFSSASLRRANLILTVSEHARSQIAHYGRVDSDKIVVIPHAPTPDLRRIDDTHTLNAVRTRYGIERPFVLADALKNPSAVLRAWGLLSCVIRDRHDLILFSRRKENEIVIQEAVSRGSTRLLIRPPREDLIALYSLASAFVFPSWTEGFGIPLLEAMTCGAPIVASNRGAIPEVVDDAALLSDPDDAPVIAQHLASILDDAEVSRTMRERGFARAAQFSWQNTARRILDSYQFAVQGA